MWPTKRFINDCIFIYFFKENENLPNFIESCFILLSCGTVWKPELIKTTGKISASQQAGLLSTYEIQVLRKANAIWNNSNHPLQNEFELLPSGCRFRVQMRRTKKLQGSFIPSAIYLLNGNSLLGCSCSLLSLHVALFAIPDKNCLFMALALDWMCLQSFGSMMSPIILLFFKNVFLEAGF